MYLYDQTKINKIEHSNDKKQDLFDNT